MTTLGDMKIIKSCKFSEFIVIPSRYNVVNNITLFKTKKSICFTYDASMIMLGLSNVDINLIRNDDYFTTSEGLKLLTMSGFLKATYASNEEISDVVRTFVESTMTILFQRGHVTIKSAQKKTLDRIRLKHSELIHRVSTLTDQKDTLEQLLNTQSKFMERKYSQMERDISAVERLRVAIEFCDTDELVEYNSKLLKLYGKSIYAYVVNRPNDTKKITHELDPDIKIIEDLNLDYYDINDGVSELDEVLIKLSDTKKGDTKNAIFSHEFHIHKGTNASKLLSHPLFKANIISFGKAKYLYMTVDYVGILIQKYNLDIIDLMLDKKTKKSRSNTKSN